MEALGETGEFQFHKGTIKTAAWLPAFVSCSCFNSIKVRLRRGLVCCRIGLVRFQFHKGTIKTPY